MQAEKQIKKLNEFIEEQLWYIENLAKEKKVNLEHHWLGEINGEKLETSLLDASGHESGDEGGNITPLTQSAAVESIKHSYDELEQQGKDTLKELIEGPKEYIGCLEPDSILKGGLRISIHEQIPIKNPIKYCH